MQNSRQKSQSGGKDAAERALLERIAGRDREALSSLYRQYYERLFKFVFRLTSSYSDTEETVNDIMLAVWRGAGSFRGDSKPSTWIFGIAYRLAVKSFSRRRFPVAPLINVEQLPDNAAPVIEREDWVHRGLDALSTTQRLTVELVFYLGLSYEEVAEVTECPVNTVKTRMFHARSKLKKQLTAAAGEAP